jgi:hypothetical protein
VVGVVVKQWGSMGGGGLEMADMYLWKMIVVPDRWKCSSLVLHYKIVWGLPRSLSGFKKIIRELL